jgi:hypothetical protein
MGGARNTEKTRNAHKIVTEKPKGNGPIGVGSKILK